MPFQLLYVSLLQPGLHKHFTEKAIYCVILSDKYSKNIELHTRRLPRPLISTFCLLSYSPVKGAGGYISCKRVTPLILGAVWSVSFNFSECCVFPAVTCAPPPLPEFGVLSYRRVKPGHVSHFLDTITFECVPPLALIGNETATCMANGNWSSIPECKGKKLPAVSPYKHTLELYR